MLPWRSVTGKCYRGGSVTGECYRGGSVTGKCYRGGSVTGECYRGGSVTGECYRGGSVTGGVTVVVVLQWCNRNGSITEMCYGGVLRGFLRVTGATCYRDVLHGSVTALVVLRGVGAGSTYSQSWNGRWGFNYDS